MARSTVIMKSFHLGEPDKDAKPSRHGVDYIPAYYKLWIMTPMRGWYRLLVEAIENLALMEGF